MPYHKAYGSSENEEKVNTKLVAPSDSGEEVENSRGRTLTFATTSMIGF